MKVTTRKKPAFRDFYENGMFARVAATRTEGGRWRLFGLHRNGEVAIFVEAARGGIREWSGLDYIGEFCASMGITLWEVHTQRQAKENPA
ncbi:hypothetical protein [Kosakonia sacchari]|uniref:hypothetical protein n=1 Tax=Kosakonia sacchari TaxID=1158459 RepID=UPI001584F284|nr:hypothetical protein [Kosakonia sacchari]NUL35065.1 hypothetical protein [Kosakonia sacchari]